MALNPDKNIHERTTQHFKQMMKEVECFVKNIRVSQYLSCKIILYTQKKQNGILIPLIALEILCRYSLYNLNKYKEFVATAI
jgi:hypothetical protein